MFRSKRTPLKDAKPNSGGHVYPINSWQNPFDSDDETKDNKNYNSSRKVSSKHALVSVEANTNIFDDFDANKSASSSSYALRSAQRNRYKNDFHVSEGLENPSVQELEDYAVHKAEETTESVNNCLKIAENIREDATQTLATLHQQGEQITRTHYAAVDINQDLSRGEKLLGSLGGLFSRTWKPKKLRPIKGPVIFGDNSVKSNGHRLEQREKLGLTSAHKRQSRQQTPHQEPTNALEKVEVEKVKQDDALSDISDILGDLKEMTIQMGSEIDRQNQALNHLEDDMDVLNSRVKGANQRGRRLLGKKFG